ncbi:MAG: hypothetical protein ABJH68_11400 [Ilumatobacter sp.]
MTTGWPPEFLGAVDRVVRLRPPMVRIVLGGSDLDGVDRAADA